ncbi:FtsH protease activity modulator HflK [Luteimonas viscosa]|uniref:Protein HflK n=1 Tax=Luteimonas viscosa TaxID=1132694 RepID=A0A5D4XLK3_9GAMM|nr:FtsH protease activity modulator HflK [Luteimonas viscosa]TYT25568.1 FtsH protease activity modulator HflK [Luteimonas viscosa]
MAWNIPGKNNDDRPPERERPGNNGRNPWPPKRRRGGNGLGDIGNRLRDLFGGGGGGGNPLRWIGIALVVWLVFNCFVLIGEQQRGVVLRFGEVARVMQPGPNFKMPWPIERVTKVDATSVRTFSNSLPVLTSDENIVTVSFNVQYRVADPEMFLFGTQNAVRVLEQIAQSSVREQIGRADLDTALNARGPLSVAASTALQASLEAYRTGLVVTELNLQDARPPEQVKPAFDEVNSAQQTNERLVNEARAYAARVVPEARGDAQRLRTTAEGYKTASVARATGDAERFTLLLDAYRNAPDVTRRRLWLETLQQVLADNRKVIGGDGRQLIYVPMNQPAGGGSSDSSAPPVLPADIVSPPVGATPDESLPRPTRAARGEGGTR